MTLSDFVEVEHWYLLLAGSPEDVPIPGIQAVISVGWGNHHQLYRINRIESDEQTPGE